MFCMVHSQNSDLRDSCHPHSAGCHHETGHTDDDSGKNWSDHSTGRLFPGKHTNKDSNHNGINDI